MLRSYAVFISAVAVALLPLNLRADDPITVGYGDAYKPFAWEQDGRIQGVQVDFVQAILVDRMGLEVEHRACPWKRCQREVREGSKDAFFTVPTLERARYTRKTIQPFYTTTFMMHTARANPFLEQLMAVRSIEDLAAIQGLRHVYMLGSGWHEDALSGMARVQTIQDAASIPSMLARDRADVYIEQAEMFFYQATEAGVATELVTLELAPLRTLGWHLFIGEDSPHARLIPKIDAVLAEMAFNGELAALKSEIFARYGIDVRP